jgi:hypothetical protein
MIQSSAYRFCLTGAKRGVMSFLATVRASRRQKNNRLGDTPWRRATATTFAPGVSVSAMIRIFSSSDQRRRRSTPPRTSTRIKTDLKARLKGGCLGKSRCEARWSLSDAY